MAKFYYEAHKSTFRELQRSCCSFLVVQLDATQPLHAPAPEKQGNELACCPAHLTLVATVATSPDIPRVVHLKKAESSIGRDRSVVDMFLDSHRVPRMISRVHAHIAHLSNNQWKLRDNRSVNGVYVNDVKVSEASLNDGDVITFGGGGNAPFGSKKQQPDSEFIYKFTVNPMHPGSGKRDFSAINATDADTVLPESSLKRRKTEETVEHIEALKKQLEEKEKESSSLLSRLSEIEKRDETFRQQEEERQRREKEIMEQIEAERTKREAQLKEKEEEFFSKLKAQEEALRAQMQLKEQSLQEFQNRLAAREQELSKARENEATFHNELQQLKQQVEKSKQERDAERATLKQLQEQLVKQREQAQLTSSRHIERSAVEEELTCSICQELLCDAQTLECSHSFCGDCLDQWRKQKPECPMCRHRITKPPIKSITLDSIIGKLVENFGADEKQAWNARMAQKVADEPYRKLEEMIRTAKEKKLKFLDISQKWSPAERKTFADGVARYEGRARILYMSTTGLTEEWLRRTPGPALIIAAGNVGVSAVGGTEAVRKRLLEFFHGVRPRQPDVINV